MTKISWTDKTDNVIVVKGADGKMNGWYCEKVSAGCAHCYAEKLNNNVFFGGNNLPYIKSKKGARPPLLLRRDIMEQWPRQRKTKRHFVNSMTDTFGEFVPNEWIFEIFDAMTNAPNQEFQILTKRAMRMNKQVTLWLRARGYRRVPPNIILMVSVEDQQRADERIPWLLSIPARHGLSVEPMLEPVDLFDVDGDISVSMGGWSTLFPADMIDWVIVGGESGNDARRFDMTWLYSIVKQCKEAAIPVFVKQFGENPTSVPVGFTITGKGADWAEWPPEFRVREFPQVTAVSPIDGCIKYE